eukprot:jgi/Undpi1/8658/HiC_scaffold_25.g11123.m1
MGAGVCSLVEAVDSGDPSAVGAAVSVIGNEQAASQLSTLSIYDDEQLETIVMLAARSGDVEMFYAVLRSLKRTLSQQEIIVILEARGGDGSSLLTAAAEGGNKAIFSDASDLMGGKDKVWGTLSGGEACYLMEMAARSGNVEMFNTAKEAVMLRGKAAGIFAIDSGHRPYETSVVVEAAGSGCGAMVDAVVAAMSDLLTAERAVAALSSCTGPRRMSALMAAAERGSVEAVTAVMNAVSSILVGTKAACNMVAAKDVQGLTAMSYATNSGVIEVISIVSASMARYLPPSKIGIKLANVYSGYVGVGGSSSGFDLSASDLFRAGRARPARVHAIEPRHVLINTFFLSLSDDVNRASLPQTYATNKMIDVYSASLAMCCANLPTPVDREVLTAISFLLRHGAKPEVLGLIRLSTSLPPPRLKDCILGAVVSADNPFVPGMNLSVALTVAARRAVEGEKHGLLSLQAAVDELLLEVLEHLPPTVRGFEGNLMTCSAVFEPETTMSRDGVFADGKIPFLGISMNSSHEDNKLSRVTNFPGARFIVVGLLSRPDTYYKVPALRMMLEFVAYLYTMVIFAGYVLLNEDNSFDWAEITFASYVCGAIVRELGDIVQDPFKYILDKWNVLDVTSLCLMFMGLCYRAFGGADSNASLYLYALSTPLAFSRLLFYAQILPSQGPMIQVIVSMTGELVKFVTLMLVVMLGFVMAFYSLFPLPGNFGVICLKAFKAMLGETHFFQDVSGDVFDTISTVLLVAYLIILTVMMLNLLVAVLNTAHTKVDKNPDREYKWAFSCPMFMVDWCCSTNLRKDTKRFFGRAVFWVIIGPIAVATGWFLWILSVPMMVTVRYLDDPMSDPDVRRDEETRDTTVEHVKLLRNRLETTTNEHITDLRSYLVRTTQDFSWTMGQAATTNGGDNRIANCNKSGPGEIERLFKARVNKLDRELDAKTAKLEKRMSALVDEQLRVLLQKLDAVLGKETE